MNVAKYVLFAISCGLIGALLTLIGCIHSDIKAWDLKPQKITFKLYKQLSNENPEKWALKTPFGFFRAIIVVNIEEYYRYKCEYMIRNRDRLQAWLYFRKKVNKKCLKTKEQWEEYDKG